MPALAPDRSERVFADGAIDGIRQELAQHLGADLILVARAYDGARCVSWSKPGNLRGFGVLVADTIVSAAYHRRLDLDLDLLTSWGDVCNFSFHLFGS